MPSPDQLGLLAHEAVLDGDRIVGEIILVEKVTVLLFEIVVAVVACYDFAILNLECIAKVIVHVIAPDLDIPAGEVFAVEELLPFFLVGLDFFWAGATQEARAKNKRIR